MSPISFPISLEIIKIIQETDTAKTYFLENPDNALSFKAGQFLTLNEDLSKPSLTRNYSICKAPFEKEIAITIKRQENGYFSRLVFDNKKLGDRMKVIGVFGKFVLPSDYADYHFLFFAAGSGIAPIFSLIKEILHYSKHTKIRLYYSNKAKSQTIYFEELNQLATQNPSRFQIQYFFSEEHDIQNARISAFLIPEILEKLDANKTLAYLCGPLDYMDTIRMSLLTYGLPKTNAFTEEYSYFTELLDTKIRPPADTTEHKVTLFLNEKVNEIEVGYPESILTTALKQGINLPYSCSSGQCGSCMARIKKGKVWLTYNEVLTAEDLAEGWTLTCMGFPIDGDVELVYE